MFAECIALLCFYNAESVLSATAKFLVHFLKMGNLKLYIIMVY